MQQTQFARVMAGGMDASLEQRFFVVTLCAEGQLKWEGRTCSLSPDGAVGFRGGRHKGTNGLRLSFYEAVQTQNCNRYRMPCTDFEQISGDVATVDKSRDRIRIERSIVRDIENHRGANLVQLLTDWFAAEQHTDIVALRLLVIELYHIIKWRLFDAYWLSAARIKRGHEVYEILNIPSSGELHRWMIDWVNYTFSIIAPRDNLPARRVAHAVRYIEENLGQALRVGQVAAQLHMDAAYFSKLFKRETGLSPSAYILVLRLDKAHAMLKNGYAVGKTAQMLGFCDAKAFRTAFVRRFGVLPSRVNG